MAVDHWRYVFCDLLTGTELGSLPLTGVYFENKLNGAGTLGASIAVTDDTIRALDPWTMTTPRRTAVYVEQGDVVRWGGIVWHRQRGARTGVLQIVAATFDSWLAFGVLRDDAEYAAATALTIITDLVAAAQDPNATNIGLTVADGSPAGSVPVPRSRKYLATDLANIDQLLQSFTELDQAVEYRVDVARGATDYTCTLMVGEPRLGRTTAVSGLYARYPGKLLDWSDEEDGTAQAEAVAAAANLPDPRWQQVTIDGGASGGTFQLKYGTSTTTAIAWNAGLPTVEAALEALPGLANRITVGGSIGSWEVQFALHTDKVLTLSVVNEALVGTPPSAVAYGTVSADAWARLRRSQWRYRYVWGPTEAAKLIKTRIDANSALHSDLSWAGMPTLVARYHDLLLSLYRSEGNPVKMLPDKRTTDPATVWPGFLSSVSTWLDGFITRNTLELYTATSPPRNYVGEWTVPDGTTTAPPPTLYPPAGVVSNPTVTVTQDTAYTYPYFTVVRASSVGITDVSTDGWPEQTVPLSGGAWTVPQDIIDSATGEMLNLLGAGRIISGVKLHPSLMDSIQLGDDLELQIKDPVYAEWPDRHTTTVRVVGLKVTPGQGTTPTTLEAEVAPVGVRLPPHVHMTAQLRKMLARLKKLETR